MPAAFNPWPDLDSYQIAQLEEDMHKMQERMDADGDLPSGDTVREKYAVYLEAGENALEALSTHGKRTKSHRG